MPFRFLVSLFVLAIALTGFAQVESDKSRLASDLETLRKLNEPVTYEELAAFCKPAEGSPDMTKEVITALEHARRLIGSDYKTKIPDVGLFEVPIAGEEWPYEKLAMEIIGAADGQLRVLEDVAKKNGAAVFPIQYSDGFNAKIPHLGDLRIAVSLLMLNARICVRNNNIEGAINSVRTSIHTINLVEREPLSISQMIRLKQLRFVFSEILWIANNAGLSDKQLALLQEIIRPLELRKGFSYAMYGEQMIGYSACLEPEKYWGKESLKSKLARSLLASSRNNDAIQFLVLSRKVIDANQGSWIQLFESTRTVEMELKKLEDSTEKSNSLITTMVFPAASMMAPAFADAVTSRDCTDVALGAIRYRIKNGQVPKSISDLVPQFLPAIPNDPYTDKPLIFKSSGGKVLAYGVGRNRLDNGGDVELDVVAQVSVKR